MRRASNYGKHVRPASHHTRGSRFWIWAQDEAVSTKAYFHCAPSMALYVGTCIQDGGYDRAHDVGPAAGEIIRVYPDDSWELVIGSARFTEQGFKLPTSRLGPGFDNPFNGYIWSMCVHADRLYVGTMSWSVFLLYVDTTKWPQALRYFIPPHDIDSIVAQYSGCEIWSTRDGDTWTPVILNGFRNPYNCGARTLESTPYGLAVGTVNPFGPTVAVKCNEVWMYTPNRRGGGEVWLGAPQVPAAMTCRPPIGA
jgi:hypothetical protein